MLIDCDSCTARPRACGDCIVTHLLQVGPVRSSPEDSWPQPWGEPEEGSWDGRDHAPELTDSEVAAVAVLSAGGLVPPLRLVTPGPTSGGAVGTAGRTGRRGSRSRTG